MNQSEAYPNITGGVILLKKAGTSGQIRLLVRLSRVEEASNKASNLNRFL